MREFVRITIKHMACEMDAHQSVRFSIPELAAAEKNIVVRKNAFALFQRGRCGRILNFYPLDDIVLDGCDKNIPVRRKLQPMPIRSATRHKGATALLAVEQPFFAEHINGLAHGDARDLKFLLEFDQRGNLLSRAPLAALDALAHDGCHLKI
jgi:hypothetical protein